ncbi:MULTISPECIES: alpha/beta fold hydrolase [unclassified Enterococcus]|uniref:alpha/beta fold hydrolase n=1 Tax=unclassified Enterococcus TaxID=2608891 RepID=UPI001A9A8C19|nr:alpha/beta fold hydrolase [Enterococcus sp. DIV1271a]MBO1299726.1 alpha/beta fold hydrolase [Enterococcus sp. DIV1271a]
MVQRNKGNINLVLSGVVLFVLLFLAGCQTQENTTSKETTSTETTTTSQVESVEKATVPTLFIHGYKGTVNSFKGMLERLETENKGQQEIVLTVDVNGNVQAQGALSKQATNPMVQVLFEDNENNEWNQTEWIRACLVYLQTTYQIDKVNIVGHSMGGVSGLRYLVTYGQEQALPQVQKFVALGAPFNDFVDDSGQGLAELLENGPAVVSSRYQDYQSLIGNLPSDTQFLLLAGQLSETDLSDGTVPLNSALAVNALLKQHGNPVTEKVEEGEGASHSMLHENEEVDREVSQFLWNI